MYVIPIGVDCSQIVAALRKSGISTDLDLACRSPSKNLTYVNKLGIPYALIVGGKELTSGKFILKDMKTGKERKLDISQVVKLLRKVS